MIQSAGVNNSVSKLLPFEANEGINHESGPYTNLGIILFIFSLPTPSSTDKK